MLHSHGETDGSTSHGVFAIGLGDASVPFGRIYGGLQFLFSVVAALAVDALEAGLCPDGDGLHIAQEALFNHGQDIGRIEGRLVADGLAVQAIGGRGDLQDKGLGQGLQDALVLGRCAPMRLIYHHQSVADAFERRQVGGSADGIHTGDRDLSSVVIDAPTDFADQGARFDLTVLLGRLVEQFIGVGHDQGMEPIPPSELSNDLTEDDCFARRRRKDQEFLSVSVLLVGGDHAPDAGFLIGSQDDSRARGRCQNGAGCGVHGMDLLPARTLHLPEMTMTNGVENMPFHMGKRLLR